MILYGMVLTMSLSVEETTELSWIGLRNHILITLRDWQGQAMVDEHKGVSPVAGRAIWLRLNGVLFYIEIA